MLAAWDSLKLVRQPGEGYEIGLVARLHWLPKRAYRTHWCGGCLPTIFVFEKMRFPWTLTDFAFY